MSSSRIMRCNIAIFALMLIRSSGMLCPLWSYSLSAYEQKQETPLYQAGLSGLQGRGKGQSGKLLIWITEQSHASTSLQKSSGITWLTWSSSSCSCGCVESEFFRITEFTAVLLQWQGIWRTLGKQQAALNQTKIGDLDAAQPEVQKADGDREYLCGTKYQKELWYWAVS